MGIGQVGGRGRKQLSFPFDFLGTAMLSGTLPNAGTTETPDSHVLGGSTQWFIEVALNQS